MRRPQKLTVQQNSGDRWHLSSASSSTSGMWHSRREWMRSCSRMSGSGRSGSGRARRRRCPLGGHSSSSSRCRNSAGAESSTRRLPSKRSLTADKYALTTRALISNSSGCSRWWLRGAASRCACRRSRTRWTTCSSNSQHDWRGLRASPHLGTSTLLPRIRWWFASGWRSRHFTIACGICGSRSPRSSQPYVSSCRLVCAPTCRMSSSRRCLSSATQKGKV
mmetsp:Transcript_19994/g.44653  ORF Transcript_19994/g.44653 Transcript_19994/m.44653 type:complete len:221 (+) Transcript_19994:400-1062(+)